MSQIKGVEEFVMAVYEAVLPKLKKLFCSVQTGEVRSVSGSTVHVALSKGSQATPMATCCDARIGDVVVAVRQGTKYYVIGVLR